MSPGILKGKWLQYLSGYQHVDSSFSIVRVIQIMKQFLDGCSSILLVLIKQSICCIHSYFIPGGTEPYLMHVVSSEKLST